MAAFTLSQRLIAEILGTSILVSTVVGSGIMATNLTQDIGLQLLANTIPTGAILTVLITILGPISGAHFNPAVSLVFLAKQDMTIKEVSSYIMAQLIGGIIGTMIAHMMFDLPLIEFSTKVRSGAPQWFSEFISTFGLVMTILAGIQFRQSSVAWLVGLYITAAYWFTASTSFANPTVTIARSITNTFSGISPLNVPTFILAQLIGALVAWLCISWLIRTKNS